MTIRQVDKSFARAFTYNLFFLLLMVVVVLQACTSQKNYAPVVDAWQHPTPSPGIHKVQKGETLYSIAWGYGYDYREIAAANQISEPFTIHVGQNLKIEKNKYASNNVLAKKYTQQAATPHNKVTKDGTKSRELWSKSEGNKKKADKQQFAAVQQWYWPTQGQVKEKFSMTGDINKGINIAGKYGQSVRSAAPGIVVYSGSGLLGYGNLIIIKHDDDFLSAYAHNKANYVKEGTWVQAKQKIAEVGYSDGQQAMLHFEIRKAGKPIDPLKLLS